MNLDLTPRERAIGIVLSAALVGLAVVACIGHFQNRRTLMRQADNLKAELRAVTIERDSKAKQLAPFESLAQQQFPSEPADARLPLLLRRITAITSAGAHLKGRRHLEPEAIFRIRSKFDSVPTLDVEVGVVWNDPEALVLAGELRTIFESGGFKLRKLAQYIPPPAIPAGVAIYSKHDLDSLLSAGIAEIFAELGQEPIQWLEDDEASPAKQSATDPDLKIVVGRGSL